MVNILSESLLINGLRTEFVDTYQTIKNRQSSSLLGRCMDLSVQATNFPPAGWIERPDRGALKALKPSVIERHRVLPLAVEASTLHVAMQDPLDPAQIDDLAFASGLRIEPYLMSEIRLGLLLESHFGIRRNVRFIELGSDEMVAPGNGPEATDPGAVPAPTAATEEREAEARERAAHGIRPLEDHQEPTDEDDFTDLHASLQSGTGAEAAASAALAEVPDPAAATAEVAPAEGEAGRDAAADAVTLETAPRIERRQRVRQRRAAGAVAVT